uniref:tRNAHis guanylyltransferase catalytic domain-containing protein n=1 Tax=viral metagenome TaxID=1070528 RepID=A0A6C0H6P9_9ZZZZ
MYICTGVLTLLQVYYTALLGTLRFTDDSETAKPDSLQTRMSRRVKEYNGNKCHPYKPHVVSLKSSDLLKYINFVCPIGEKIDKLKVYNEILVRVAKSLYQRFDPSVIYCFNNEFHLVFFYNDAGSFLFDGNIMKTVTSVVSHATSSFIKEFLVESLNIDVHFTGTFVEFDKDYEALNYLIWRQLDCNRNNMTLMYKCVKYYSIDQEVINNVNVKEMETVIEEQFGKLPDFIHCGNVVKKALVYKSMRIPDRYYILRRVGEDVQMTQEEEYEDGLVDRKEFQVVHEKLNNNFKESFQKYVVNKLM